MVEIFGPRLADGDRAASYRMEHIRPTAAAGIEMVFDFRGVTNANSSFINALLTGLFEEHGGGILERIEFLGCRPSIQVLVESAIALGLQKAAEAAQKPCSGGTLAIAR
jgi:hypothetical protein